MSDDTPSRPPLSIVIASREPWPTIRRTLDSLYQQAMAVGAEIFVAMSDPAVAPADADKLYPAIVWLQGARDDSVFRLRAVAIPQCRSEIIALTEDHAFVGPNWCRAIIEAHAQFPEAAAIGGVVENGANETVLDWAGFFLVNGRFMRPIRNGLTDDISLQANVAYKRSALPASFPDFGLVPSIFHHQLRQSGAKLVATDQMEVHHVQVLTLGEYSAMHFHNARATGAFFHEAAPRRPWLPGFSVMMPRLLWSSLANGMAKGRNRRELILGVPLIAWLICCHAAGELVGRLRGPGNSPQLVK